ncbi:MAG: DUF2306 domain-containing protein [Cyclobacteriaceae bacterium]
MEWLRHINLFIHVVAGFTALGTGIFAFASRKGGKIHLLSGRIYVIAMLLVALSSFILSLIRFNPFLFMVGTFTLYMTFTGYRGLIKRREKTQKAKATDWLLIVFSLAMAGYMSVRATFLMEGRYQDFLPVVLTFSSILLLFIITDLRIYLGRKHMQANDWLMYHISRISGAYIGTFTAFLVINVHTDPAYISWLLPTVLGAPMISYFQRKYRVKKKGRKVERAGGAAYAKQAGEKGSLEAEA